VEKYRYDQKRLIKLLVFFLSVPLLDSTAR
jgi:hypothetical protein